MMLIFNVMHLLQDLIGDCLQHKVIKNLHSIRNARSWAGASGLMQIMPKTAKHLGLEMEDIFNPELNIALQQNTCQS